MPSFRFTFCALMLFAIAGCRPWSPNKLREKLPTSTESSSDFKVQVDASVKPLSDGQVATTKAESLVPEVRQLVADQRIQSAKALVRARPDMALETLRTNLGANAQPSTLLVIAQAYDEQMQLDVEGGWAAVVSQSKSESVATYAAARQRLQTSLSTGKNISSAADELAKTARATKSPVLELDALQQRGLAALVTNQPKQAAEFYDRACQAAGGFDGYQEIQAALMLSEALRRDEQFDLANKTWVRGVLAAAALVQTRGVFDPVYWDRASYLRPVNTLWPAEAVAVLIQRSQWISPLPLDQLSPGEAEAVIWNAIARGLIARGDHQAALVAAKRAEVSTSNGDWRGWTRLTQAEALACLDQRPAATAILVSLTTATDPQLAGAATATLGGLKLRDGDAAGGFRMLAAALVRPDSPTWPARANAEADLGLAFLMRNDEANGMKWLHSAQSSFAAANDALGLYQSLWNEAAYLKESKRHQQAREIEIRLSNLESTAR